MRVLVPCVMVLVLVLCSCTGTGQRKTSSTPKHKHGQPLMAQPDPAMVSWFESLAKIDYVGVVPSSEDVRVGDVYISRHALRGESPVDRLGQLLRIRRWR